MKFIIPCLTSLLITAMVMPFVIRFATARNCLDDPGGRRIHARSTPRWGGAAFFAGVLPFLITETESSIMAALVSSSLLLVGMGMVDDLRTLGWKVKFTGMAVATTIVIFGGGITVTAIPLPPFFGQIELGWFSIPFTYLCIIGITNAINLLDGLDGLAGGVSLLGFLFMGIAALLAGNAALAVICCAFVGALGAFLYFNFPNARVFMGDTGSLFLGFFLAVTALLLTRSSSAAVPVLFPVLLLLLPIFDTLRVMVRRLANGTNPFKADNLHLHYLMVQRHQSHQAVTLRFWCGTAILGCLGLALVGASVLTYLAVILNVSLLLGCYAARLDNKQMQKSTACAGALLSDALDGSRNYEKLITGDGFSRARAVLVRKTWFVVMGMLLLPAQSLAGTDCWFRELQDHYVAVCTGDEIFPVEHIQAGSVKHSPLPLPVTGGVAESVPGSAAPVISGGTVAPVGAPPRSAAPATAVENRAAAETVAIQQHPAGNSEVIPSMYRAPRSVLPRKKM
jgi:UDP-GlcNAc:undecaprenyl-phosphate GlcNAc-1-phosphate transferase